MLIPDRQRHEMSLPLAAHLASDSCLGQRLWTAGHSQGPAMVLQPPGISYSCQALGAPICPGGMPALQTSFSSTTTPSLPDPPSMPRHERHLQTITPPQKTILQCHSTALEQAGWHRQGAPQRIKEGTHQGLQRFEQGTEAQCYQLHPRNTKKTHDPQEMSRTAHCSAMATTTSPGCSCLCLHPSGYGDLLQYREHCPCPSSPQYIIIKQRDPSPKHHHPTWSNPTSTTFPMKETAHTSPASDAPSPSNQKYLPRSAALASSCMGQRGCFLCSNDLHHCITARKLLRENRNDHFPFS